MLHIFCNGYTRVFLMDIYYKCFSCFERMLQVFHLDVVKVDLVLQWSSPAVLHARGKRRDGTGRGDERKKRRGMAGHGLSSLGETR